MWTSLLIELLIIEDKTSSPKNIEFTRFDCIWGHKARIYLLVDLRTLLL